MTARSIDKRTDNIVIGAGEVYLDLHEGGASTGERYLGDAVGAALEITTEETTVFSGSGPVARELARIARSVTRTVTLTLHDLSLENLALFAVGEMRRLNAAAPVSGEPAVLRPGRWHQLGGADRPAGVLGLPSPADKATAIAAVTVSTTAQTPVTATQAVAAGQLRPAPARPSRRGNTSSTTIAPASIGCRPITHSTRRRPASRPAPMSPSTIRRTMGRATRCRVRCGR